MQEWELRRALAILDGWIKAIDDYVPSWQDPTHPAYDPSHPEFEAPPPQPKGGYVERAEKMLQDSEAGKKMRERVRTKRLAAMESTADEMKHISWLLNDTDTALSHTTKRHLIERFDELSTKFDTLQALFKQDYVHATWEAKQGGTRNAGKMLVLDSGAEIVYADSDTPAVIIPNIDDRLTDDQWRQLRSNLRAQLSR